MATTQIQLKISLSPQLNALLKAKAKLLGLPVTQFVKHIIVEKVEPEDQYPVYKASKRTIREAKQAMKDIDKAVDITDVHEFFKNL